MSAAGVKARHFALALLALVAVLAALLAPAYPQDPAYHGFADQRAWLSFPNFQNVASNVPFLIVGLAGLWALGRGRETSEKAAWIILFSGVVLTGLGSAYYHWSPSNETLVWDRLPMTLAFMALFASALGERVSQRFYNLALLPLVSMGLASVVYWSVTEHSGAGDLRPYILVQFFPLLAIPLMMVLYPAKYTHARYVFFALGSYGVAKALELLDEPIYAALGNAVGGHALKHMAAALGCFFLYRMFVLRRLKGS